MTIATLIITCLLFVALGWTGDVYGPVALCVGAIVCIAAANAGNTSQDLKTGYIVGATPLYQQIGLVIGVVMSAFVIGVTTLYLHGVFAIGSAAIAAPQATLMATIIKGLLSQNLPVGAGARRRLHGRHAGTVRHPLAVVRGRRVSADCDHRADLRRRPGALVGREQDRRQGGVRTRRRNAVQLGADRRRIDLRGSCSPCWSGTETIGPFQAIGNLVPWLHDEGTIAQIGSGLLFFALAVVTARAARRRCGLAGERQD